VFLADVMKLDIVAVLYAEFAYFPEHYCCHCLSGATVLNPSIRNRLAHADHGSLLRTLNFTASAYTNGMMPGLLNRDEIDFILELAIDMIEKRVPFLFGKFDPSCKVVVLEEVFVLKACAINRVTREFLDGEDLILVFFLLVFLIVLLPIVFLLLFLL
jgi:hypothetical protein